MSDLPGHALRLGPVRDLPPGRTRLVEVGDESIAVHNLDGCIYATSAVCHHQQAPLHDGRLATVDGAPVVTCPWHGWQYRLDDGRRVDRAGTPLTTYPLAVRAGWIFCLDEP